MTADDMRSRWPNGALRLAIGGRRPNRPRPRLLALGVAIAACAGALLLAPAMASAAPDPVYGIVTQDGELPPAEDMELMHEGGVESIRLMAHWGSVEFVPGARDWSSLDSLVRETTARGIQPLLFLYGLAGLGGASGRSPVRARLLDHPAVLEADPPGVRAVRP